MRHPYLNQILLEVRQHLEYLYGARLAGIFLYGSQARGDATPNSDIDILVTLHDSFDALAEINRTTPFIADLCLHWEVLISVNIVPDQKLKQTQMPFFINLRREGISA